VLAILNNDYAGDFPGLSYTEVRLKQERGQTNSLRQAPSKSYGSILADNILTLFNFVNVALAILVFSVGSYLNLLFLGVVIANTCIGIVQEIRAKRAVEKLALILQPHVEVVREGVSEPISVEEVVLDDMLLLKAGEQIPADAMVLAVDELEVDESLLTGESRPVRKAEGDEVLSGSFVTAGTGCARVLRVGRESYAAKLAQEARRYKRNRSQLTAALKRIIQVLSIVIVPVGVLLFYSQRWGGIPYAGAVVTTAAGMVGMIPEGLILLSTVAFAVGVINLSRQKTLVQALPCLEMLARVDVLCLDKTGTITDGAMEVEEVLLEQAEMAPLVDQALRALINLETETNPTQLALRRRFGEGAPTESCWEVRQAVPFSSRRRWGGACFTGSGWVLGAPEVLCPNAAAKAAGYAAQGLRVVALARVWGDLRAETVPEAGSAAALASDEAVLPERREVYALLVLADTIRPQAAESLRFFAEQGVTVKVISGDNPLTVAATAQKAGLGGADRFIDLTAPSDCDDWRVVAEEFTVFGRVDPHSKKKLIQALRGNGHIVGMTGDGVNDVPALKESDCGVAMASGSQAARSVADLVLLESDFAPLPAVVREGRRVVNNIERVAVLYLLKTVYSALLCLFFILLREPYPLYPIHLSLIGMTSIGIPSFFLALAANKNRVEGDFLKKTLRRAIPCGILVVIDVLTIQALDVLWAWEPIMARTLTVSVIGAVGLCVLANLCYPLHGKRLGLLISMIALFVVGYSGLSLLGGADWPGLSLGDGFHLPWWELGLPVTIGFLFAVVLNGWLVRKIFWFKRYKLE